PMQGCTRLAVKLDFITGALYKALQCTGSLEFRGVQAQVGEVVAWRNLFWSLTDAMYGNASEWHGGAFLPSAEALQAYRVLAPQAYPEIKKTIEQVVASGLIYLPSGVRDLHNPQLDKYLSTYCRGSGGMGHRERIKILKLLWDAIGSEFGGRHELYEINYAGSQDEIRMQALRQAIGSGAMKGMLGMVEQCMGDYDENGWTVPHLHNPDDINVLDRIRQ
ncbi:TPA: Pyoverdin chromophore biosynthetic protein pvcC, partial [Pseudomonas aeruginosa]|nr:Pyoverdin chromophore biosynthetic protein pvcC [Pseudomonas aeruginosa]